MHPESRKPRKATAVETPAQRQDTPTPSARTARTRRSTPASAAGRSPQLGLRDVDVVRELTALADDSRPE